MPFTWMDLINFNPDFIKFSFDAKFSAIYTTSTRFWKLNPSARESSGRLLGWIESNDTWP